MIDSLGTLLIVDDNPDDYEATVRSLRKNHLINPIVWCKSGQDAKNYLFKEGQYTEAAVARPLMILLDLNMPGLDGRELLQVIKRNEELRRIPILILTTSNDPRDVEECYSFGASSFIQKPVSFEALTEIIAKLKDFWFGVALLPEIEDHSDGNKNRIDN